MNVEDRVETLSVMLTEDARSPYLDEPGFLKARRRDAAFSLADAIFEKASIMRERKIDDWRLERIWTVSVVMPDNGRNRFEEQKTASRNEGLLAAAERLRETARRYRERNAGPCSFSIASALEDEAKAIAKLCA